MLNQVARLVRAERPGQTQDVDGFQQVSLPLAIGSGNDVDVRKKLQVLLSEVSESRYRKAGENH